MLSPGDRLMNYKIVRALGGGGFGTVYLARDLNLDLDVALKVLREDGAQDEALVQRLRTGARAAAHLRHPHIQQIFYQGVDPGRNLPFVAMEYLPGGDLRARIGKLELAAALRVFADVCDAVAYAHEHGVIHRDLKPDNVLFNARGEVVVTDFDLARVEGEARLTRMGQTLGTMYYISPEQARGEAIDSATDLYALGVMLFELVSGTWPFTGRSAAEVMRAHLQEPPPRASRVAPGVPEYLDAVIAHAMAKDPRERYASARDLASAAVGPTAARDSLADENLATMLEPGKRARPAPPPPPAPRAPTLKVLDGALAGREFRLGPATALGYLPENDIVVPDDYVSGAHARIDREGDAYLLRDLNSTNGTRVAGQELTPYVPHRLKDGDLFELGGVRLRFVA